MTFMKVNIRLSRYCLREILRGADSEIALWKQEVSFIYQSELRHKTAHVCHFRRLV